MLLSRVNSNRLLLPLHLESGIPTLCFPGGSVGKEYACNAGDMGLISGAERFPEGRHGNPLQYSCLENPLGRGAWRAAVVGSHGVSESKTTEGTEHVYALCSCGWSVCFCLALGWITACCLPFLSFYKPFEKKGCRFIFIFLSSIFRHGALYLVNA